MRNIFFFLAILAVGCKKDSINVTANDAEFFTVHNAIKGNWYEKSGVRVRVTDSKVEWTKEDDRPDLPKVVFGISSAEGSGNNSDVVSVARYYGKAEKLTVYLYDGSVVMEVLVDGISKGFATFSR